MELTSAFVLHHRPYRETSLLVDIITREYGLIHLVARGMRQQKKRSTSMQLFQPMWLNWFGRGELVTLNQIEIDEAAYRLVGNASLCGLYMNELLVKLLPINDAEPEIYDAYAHALDSLHRHEDEQITLRLFEKNLLSFLGYALLLTHDAETGEPIDDELRYLYHPDNGPKRVDESEVQHTISGRSLRHLHEETTFDATSLKEIKRMMRSTINYYLAGKPLYSRQMFAELNHYSAKSD